jgi:prefoldin subunit 5
MSVLGKDFEEAMKQLKTTLTKLEMAVDRLNEILAKVNSTMNSALK